MIVKERKALKNSKQIQIGHTKDELIWSWGGLCELRETESTHVQMHAISPSTGEKTHTHTHTHKTPS